jgi:hypothetical protein
MALSGLHYDRLALTPAFDRRHAAANRTWGEERIASELLVKLGIRV